jgi:eukaryotic-like serine/threonine-protein kinase
MVGNPRVLGLLEEMLESGKTPDEVCCDCPELLPEVRERWREFRLIDAAVVELLPGLGTSPDTCPFTPGPPTAGSPQVPGYEVEAVLGRGGMGVVYKARQRALDRPVVIKMLLAGPFASPRELERFRREAAALACLRHPNVVQVFDAGDVEGRPYFAMELVEGGSLARILSGMPQSARPAAALVATLAGAVEAAHQAGIVHRDLKPANVLITADGNPKVSDFGLARRLGGEDGLTRTGAALGTPSYMAPEQAEGRAEAVGPAADVYSLGAILYEQLTGRPPFRAETDLETVQQVISREPVPPSRLNATVPRDLETVCLKCLHKDPLRRYGSAAALADDLGRFQRGEAIAARPESLVRRWARRVRRRPLFSAAAAGVFVLVAALAGGALWVVSDRAAGERAAEDDMREMIEHRERSAWPEARAALGRAKARLGDRGSADIRRRIDRADVELTLIDKLDDARLVSIRMVGGQYSLDQANDAYEAAFREAGVWLPGDAPEVVADRIKHSDVSMALVNALDSWVGLTVNEYDSRRDRLSEIARLADPDTNGWRKRTQDPALGKDKLAVKRVATDVEDFPTADPRISMFLLFADRCRKAGIDPSPMLKRVHRMQPSDFWLNLKLGSDAEAVRRYEEAVQFYHSAVVLRPDSSIAHNNLAMNLRRMKDRNVEVIEHLKEACRLDPDSLVIRVNLANELTVLSRHAEALGHTRIALRSEPNSALLHEILARNLEDQKQDDEALTEHRRAVQCDNRFFPGQAGLRGYFLRRGRAEEAMTVWKTALAVDPPDHIAWYGYAELCLYLGHEDEYRIARSKLLARFATETSPGIAEQVSRACLLRPTQGGELKQAAALADRAVAADRARFGAAFGHFQFARGLADYRQARFDQAVGAMRGEASRVLGPAPKLVLAMALYQQGEVAEARKALAAAVAGHDWSPTNARDQDGWIYHSLRREAEAMIQADPPKR